MAPLPLIRTRGEILRRRLILGAAFALVLIVLPAGLWFVQTRIMPLDQLLDLTLARLGLTGVFVYEQAGYTVTIERSMRKALPQVRKLKPAVIVAEFNFQSDFRDRTSSLESLLAVVQTLTATKVIVFYDAEQAHQFERLRVRFPIEAALSYPIDPAKLDAALAGV